MYKNLIPLSLPGVIPLVNSQSSVKPSGLKKKKNGLDNK